MPFASASSAPFLTAGTNSLGTTPPTMSFSNTKPAPRSSGEISSQTWPYCPRPPLWRMKRPSPFAAARSVSR